MSYSNINHVVLIGRLTRDPELRELPSGQSVCDLRVACNASRRDPEGEYRERPSFFDVNAFGGLAESIGRYLHKGSRIAVDGRLEWREWETADQQRRQAVRILADAVEFLDAPGTARGDGEHDDLDGEREGALAGVGAGEVDLVF
jgi:single-strand DNA-binding protein